MKEMKEQFGDIYVFWTGPKAHVVVTNVKCADKILGDTTTFLKKGTDLTEKFERREVLNDCVLDLGKLDKRGRAMTAKLPAGTEVLLPMFFMVREANGLANYCKQLGSGGFTTCKNVGAPAFEKKHA